MTKKPAIAKKPPVGARQAVSSDPGREVWQVLMDLLRENMDSTYAALEDLGLSTASANLLRFLDPEAPATMVSLAKALRCHDSNVTGLVDRLEERGMIERRSDPRDRRVKLIALTQAGLALRERLVDRLGDPPPFIKALSAADKRLLRDLLRKSEPRR